MSTTIDDLIALKDEAVHACLEVTQAWEKGDLAGAAQLCGAAVESSEVYDEAERDDSVCSVEEYERKQAGEPPRPGERPEGGRI